MPKGTENQLSKIFALLYGIPKVRKTTWALRAAEFGYNVTVLDGDKGCSVVSQLTPAARERVNIINCYDTASNPIFASLLTRFIKNEPIWWDDTDSKYISILENKAKPDHAYFTLQLEKFTKNDVILIDGIRPLIYSIAWQQIEAGLTKSKKKDITEMVKQDWDLYAFAMSLLNTYCTRLRACDAHVIFISHTEVNEETKPGKDEDGDAIRVPTGKVNEQPLSSSRKHGATIASFFDDVLRFELEGPNIYVTTKPVEDKQAGSRGIFLRDRWENFQFDKLAAAYGFSANPNESSQGCVYYPAGILTERPGLIKRQIAVNTGSNNQPLQGAQGVVIPGSQPAATSEASKQASNQVGIQVHKKG